MESRLADATARGFLVCTIPSNDWHGGHQLEPAKDCADLSSSERRIGYHNTIDGGFRLANLKNYLASVVQRYLVAAGTGTAVGDRRGQVIG